MKACKIHIGEKCIGCGVCLSPEHYMTEAEIQIEIYLGNIDEDTREWITD